MTRKKKKNNRPIGLVRERGREREQNGLTSGTPANLDFSRKHLPYSCGPATVGARAGNAEALRTKSIGAAPPINITANLAKPAFAPNGTFTLPLNGDQAAAAARLSCKLQTQTPPHPPAHHQHTHTHTHTPNPHPLQGSGRLAHGGITCRDSRRSQHGVCKVQCSREEEEEEESKTEQSSTDHQHARCGFFRNYSSSDTGM